MGPVGLRPVLILDGDQRQALVSLRALGRAGVPSCVVESFPGVAAFASRLCTARAVFPDVAQDRAGYAERLVDLCGAYRGSVIIPSHDGTIEALRAHREQVESVASIALARPLALAQAVDKTATLAMAQRLGLRTPPGAIVRTAVEGAAALASLGLPVVVKPAISWLGDLPTALRAQAHLITDCKAAQTYIDYLLDAGSDVLVQKWLSGAREAVSLLYADERVWAIFAQRADRMAPLLGGSSVLRTSIPVPPDIGPQSEALIREMSLEGYSEVEFRRDRDGTPFLMEINPRLSASVEIAVRAGVNFPVLLYDWAAGRPLRSVSGYRYGLRMRWLGGDLRWLRAAWADPRHLDSPGRRGALGTFIADFTRPAGYDYVDLRDPRPALVAGRRAIGSAVARWR